MHGGKQAAPTSKQNEHMRLMHADITQNALY